MGLHLLERLVAVVGGLHFEAFTSEVQARELDDVPLVINDEDGRGHAAFLMSTTCLVIMTMQLDMGKSPRPPLPRS
jgi:hypothetical protein